MATVWQETKAPDGYHLNKDWYVIFQIREDGIIVDTSIQTPTAAQVSTGFAGKIAGASKMADAKSGWYEQNGMLTVNTLSFAKLEEDIYHGGVSFNKIDEEGNANNHLLGNAKIEVYNISNYDVKVNDIWYNTGKSLYDTTSTANIRNVASAFRDQTSVKPVIVLTTDEDGFATTDTDGDGKDYTLPYGSYVAIEIQRADGYVLNKEWFTAFQIHPNKEADDGIILNTHTSAENAAKKGDVNTTCIFKENTGVSPRFGISIPLDPWYVTGSGSSSADTSTMTLSSGGYGRLQLTDLAAGAEYVLSYSVKTSSGTSSVKTTAGNAASPVSQNTSVNGTAKVVNVKFTASSDQILLKVDNTGNNTVVLTDIVLAATDDNGHGTGTYTASKYDGSGLSMINTAHKGSLYQSYNELVIFKYDGANNKGIRNVTFEVWTDDVEAGVVIGEDEFGNTITNHQQFTTNADGRIILKKLLSGKGNSVEPYRYRIYFVKEVAHDGEYIDNNTVWTVMVDKDGILYGEDPEDSSSYRAAATKYAQAMKDLENAEIGKENAAKQLAASRQILAEAQAANRSSAPGTKDSSTGTANAVEYAQIQVRNSEAYVTRAEETYTRALAAYNAAKAEMQQYEDGMESGTYDQSRYVKGQGMVMLGLNVPNIHHESVSLATGGAGRTLIYIIGGSLLVVIIAAFVIIMAKRKKEDDEEEQEA